MKTHWKLNVVGIAIYMFITCYLLIACSIRTMILVDAGENPILPLIGVLLGGLMLFGIGFGRIHEHDDWLKSPPPRDVPARHIESAHVIYTNRPGSKYVGVADVDKR